MTQPRGDSGEQVARLIAERVTDVPGFPQPGIVFKDLSPLFADPGPGGARGRPGGRVQRPVGAFVPGRAQAAARSSGTCPADRLSRGNAADTEPARADAGA